MSGVQCGWRGCQAGHSIDELPVGWTSLIVHATSPSKKAVRLVGITSRRRPVLDLERLDWRHDKELRPEHSRALDELLAPGPMSSDVAGRA